MEKDKFLEELKGQIIEYSAFGNESSVFCKLIDYNESFYKFQMNHEDTSLVSRLAIARIRLADKKGIDFFKDYLNKAKKGEIPRTGGSPNYTN